MLEQLEQQVRRVILAAQVPRAIRVLLVQSAQQDPKGFLDQLAWVALKARPEMRALVDLLAPKARKAIRDQQALRGPWATRARLVQQARLERQSA